MSQCATAAAAAAAAMAVTFAAAVVAVAAVAAMLLVVAVTLNPYQESLVVRRLRLARFWSRPSTSSTSPRLSHCCNLWLRASSLNL